MKRVFLMAVSLLILSSTPLPAQNEVSPPEIKSERAVTPLKDASDPYGMLKEEPVEEVPESNFYKEFFNMLLTLGFLLALLFAFSYFLRRMNLTRVKYANETSEIKILDQRVLSPRSSVFVLQYRGTEFFLGESQSGITLLNSIEGVLENDAPPAKRFME